MRTRLPLLLFAALAAGCPEQPAPEPEQLPQSGQTFVVAGAQATEIEPPFLNSLAGDLYMLATVRSYDGSEIAIDLVQAAAEGEELVQGCGEVATYPSGSVDEDGQFSVGPGTVSVEAAFGGGTFPVVVQNSSLGGRLDERGDRIWDATLTGEVDIAPWAEVAGFAVFEMCAFLPSFAGAECVPCVTIDSMCLEVSIAVSTVDLDLQATPVLEVVQGC